MEYLFIWASAHNISETQIKELTHRGQIMILRDENPEMFNLISESPQDTEELELLAERLIDWINSLGRVVFIVQPAGSPAFQYALGARGLRTMYAHSRRVSEDAIQPDGSVRKVSIFRHEGWTEF